MLKKFKDAGINFYVFSSLIPQEGWVIINFMWCGGKNFPLFYLQYIYKFNIVHINKIVSQILKFLRIQPHVFVNPGSHDL